MHDLRRKHRHPPWPSLTSLRIITAEFDWHRKKEFSLCCGFRAEMFKQEKDQSRFVERESESGAFRKRFEK